MIGVRYLQIFLLAIVCFIRNGIQTNFQNTIFSMIDDQWFLKDPKLISECIIWSYVIGLVGFSIMIIKYNNVFIVVSIILSCGLLNVLTPTLVIKIGWVASLFCLIAVTFGLSVVDVIIHNFMSRWIPISERARLSAVVFSGISVGPLFYQLIETSSFQSNYRSQGIYYLHGIVAIVWSLLFLFLGVKFSSEHPFIRAAEEHYIESNPDPSMRTHNEFPWKRIITSLPAWSLLFCICGHIWSFEVFNAYLLKCIYSNYNTFTKIGQFDDVVTYLAVVITPLVVGVLSDIFVRFGVSIGLVRKVVNTISMWGSAASVLVLYLIKIESVIDLIYFTIAIRGLNVGVNCGYMLNAMDLCPNFAGTLFGIVYAAAIVYSYLMWTIVNYFLLNEATVFYIALVTSLAANGIFITFGSGKNQQWEKSISTTDNPAYPNSTAQRNQHNGKTA